jgi:hypothetical protein
VDINQRGQDWQVSPLDVLLRHTVASFSPINNSCSVLAGCGTTMHTFHDSSKALPCSTCTTAKLGPPDRDANHTIYGYGCTLYGEHTAPGHTITHLYLQYMHQLLQTNPLEFWTANITYPRTLQHYTLFRRAMLLEHLRRDIS